MSDTGNDHGWGKPIGHTGGATAFAAPLVEERRRCVCPRDWCTREATQEDLRCDECRAVCRG